MERPYVPILIKMRDEATGEIRQFDEATKYVNGAIFLFPWTEGNFSCDCNRLNMFFDDDLNYPCGDERISIEIYNLSGELLYSEFDGVRASD